MDCSPPGSSFHGILPAWVLEWVAVPSFRGSSWSRDQTHISYISCIGRRVLYPLAPPGKPVSGVAKSIIAALILHNSRDSTEKTMATHSSSLAWKIPWTEEPGRLQSVGSLRVGHDWATSLSLFTFMHWRRKWHPTPVFLPRESQGRGSLVGCHLWGRTESDTTEAT